MTKKVIVAGGGLIGCTIAWRLASRGADVHVVESSRPGTGASWAAAGMLVPLVHAHHHALGALAASSSAAFPQFVNELHEATGIDAELQLSGKVDVAFSDSDLQILRSRYGSSLPGDVSEIDPLAAHALEPALADGVTAAIVSAGDGSVDNRKLTRAAWVAASNAGVRFTAGSSVREVLCSRSRFEAVYLSTGERIEADAVVVCAGAWSSGMRGLPQPLPVFPVRGQMVALEHVPRVISRIVMSLHCYIVPRSDGRVLIGSTVERAGFDPRTTARGIEYLLREGMRAVPALGDGALIETWAGLRPGTPDELPILGPDPRAPGVFYATGHFRNGILLAPVTADLLTAAVLDERMDASLAAFSVERFHG